MKVVDSAWGMTNKPSFRKIIHKNLYKISIFFESSYF